MILTIKDRLLIPSILPDCGNIVTMLIAQSITAKTKVSVSEIEKYGIKSENGRILWISNIPDEGLDVEFEKSEISLMKEGIQKLDENKNVTLDILGLCLKIKEA